MFVGTAHNLWMILMAILCVVMLAGLAAIWFWGDLDLQKPWADEEGTVPPPSDALRRYLWYVTVAVAAGVGSGVVMLGIGGRLVMRLLAATSSDAVQGRITEADEVVGEITLGGSMGLIIFVGLLGGLVTGALYMLIRRWLPKGRLGGLTYGAILLVLFASRIDPLRPDNKDFDIVGPGWLSVVAYVAIILGHGMLMSALAGRYSRALPLITKQLRTIARYVPFLFLAPALPLLLLVAVGAVIGLALGRVEGIRALLASERFLLTGRVAGVVLVAVALPSFLSAVIEIVRASSS